MAAPSSPAPDSSTPDSTRPDTSTHGSSNANPTAAPSSPSGGQESLFSMTSCSRRRGEGGPVGAHNLEPVDFIAGGFPCKGASNAGPRTGLDHPETALWAEFARIVGELRPRYVAVENVAAIRSIHSGAVWGTVLWDLAALGYDVAWGCVRASDVGAPHGRDRIFAVARHAADVAWPGVHRSGGMDLRTLARSTLLPTPAAHGGEHAVETRMAWRKRTRRWTAARGTRSRASGLAPGWRSA
jgi:site-specific DNA-cytosine methylase